VKAAREAQAHHAACGGPPSRPIYFSVDFDTNPSQYQVIGDFFRGIISVIGLARTGAYGEYEIIKYLFDHGLIYLNPRTGKGWGWQTYAWSAGAWEDRCSLAQDKNGVALGGGEVDLDSAHADDFGQWNYKPGSEEGELSSADADRVIKELTTLINAKAAENAKSHTLMYRGDTDSHGQAIPPGKNTHPANMEFIHKALTQRQRLVKHPAHAAIYYGDHIVRRWVDDPAELAKLQEQLRVAGLDPNVYTLAAGEQLDGWGVLLGKDPYPPKEPAAPATSSTPAAPPTPPAFRAPRRDGDTGIPDDF
jgi:hypothetical protein